MNLINTVYLHKRKFLFKCNNMQVPTRSSNSASIARKYYSELRPAGSRIYNQTMQIRIVVIRGEMYDGYYKIANWPPSAGKRRRSRGYAGKPLPFQPQFQSENFIVDVYPMTCSQLIRFIVDGRSCFGLTSDGPRMLIRLLILERISLKFFKGNHLVSGYEKRLFVDFQIFIHLLAVKIIAVLR